MAKNRAPRTAAQGDKRFSADKLGEDLPELMDEIDDDEITTGGTMVPVVCIHQGPPVRFTISGRKYKMAYGDVENIEVAYATPVQVRPQTDPLPSVIERMTNRKILPVNDARVDKDADGSPLAAQAAHARAAARLAALKESKAAPAGVR